MNVKAGLWIDRKKAVIMVISGKNENIVTIESKYKKKFRSASGKNDSNPNGKENVTPDDIQERAYMKHLSHYYDEVISSFSKAGSIYIFGPGESKGELVKRIRANKLAGRVLNIETAGKMTDRQIAAKVRSYFININKRTSILNATSHNMPDFNVTPAKK